MHAIGYCLPLCFADKLSQRTAQGTDQGSHADQTDEKRYVLESDAVVWTRQGSSCRVHHQLHEIEPKEWEQTLYDKEHRAGYHPAWTALPDQT